MDITPARLKDLASIIQLRQDAFLQETPKHYSSIEVKNLLGDYSEDEFKQMIEDRSLFVCKDKDGIIVGTSGWKNENIRHMYIKPDSMGQGIGRQLLKHAENDYMRRTKKKLHKCRSHYLCKRIL